MFERILIIVLLIIISIWFGEAIYNPDEQQNVINENIGTLRITSTSYNNDDATMNVYVDGTIKIPINYKDKINIDDGLIINSIDFVINDTTKWLSSLILNDGKWYTQHDHRLLCKYGVLDFYKSDSIYYYKGGVIKHKSIIKH